MTQRESTRACRISTDVLFVVGLIIDYIYIVIHIVLNKQPTLSTFRNRKYNDGFILEPLNLVFPIAVRLSLC